MIIDLHTHTGPGLAQHRDVSTPLDASTGRALVSLMDTAGIDKAVVFPPLWEGGTFVDPNYEAANTAIRTAIEAYPDRLIGFVRVNPYFDQLAAEEVVKNLAHDGVRGIMLHPDWECFYPDSEWVHRLLSIANDFGALVAFHSGESDYLGQSGPALYLQLSTRFPNVPIILKHMGFRLTQDAIAVALERPNIYLETSGNLTSNINYAILRLGADRIIFGSDTPYHSPRVEAMKIQRLPTISDSDKQKVLGENLRRLLRLPE